MKKFFIGLIKNIFLQILSFTLIIGFIAFASIAWPSSAPSGETTGGKFASVLNSILQSGNYATDTTGKVKLATNSDNASSVPWSGITGKPATSIRVIDSNYNPINFVTLVKHPGCTDLNYPNNKGYSCYHKVTTTLKTSDYNCVGALAGFEDYANFGIPGTIMSMSCHAVGSGTYREIIHRIWINLSLDKYDSVTCTITCFPK